MSFERRPIVYQQRPAQSLRRVPVATPQSIPVTDTDAFKPETSIVIPVINESDNIIPLIARIRASLRYRRTEVIFVDDSTDNLTVEAVEKARQLYGGQTLNIQIIHRMGEKQQGGLSGAVVDGIQAARSWPVIVMDGDLQHPPEMIPDMIEAAKTHDVVIASRNLAGGSSAGLRGSIRNLVSRGSTWLAKALFPKRLKGISDPMTGFFMADSSKLYRSRLRPKGFKILLEILANHPELSVAEVPLKFVPRTKGSGHASVWQGIVYLRQLLGLRVGVYIRRFQSLPKVVQFSSIGGLVFAIGMALLYSLVEYGSVSPVLANAVQLAVTFWLNYLLNRHITWHERSVSRRAAFKFLVSRATTTVINYFLFIWLISLQFAFSLAGQSYEFSLHYLAANVVALLGVMVLNYEISDRWIFADGKKTGRPAGSQARRFRRPGLSLAASLTISLVLIIISSMTWAPASVLPIVLAATSLGLFLQASIEAWRMMYSYREPASVDKLKFPEPLAGGPREKFCLIVPARHEGELLGHTLRQLAKQTHQNVSIVCVICDDDDDTLAVARAAAAREQRVRVLAYPLASGIKPSKPLQLNYVLQQIAGEGFTLIGIFDAEDSVHPDLLRHVEAAFADKSIDLVQGGVQLMNHDSSWYSLHNVLEYYRWFNSAMAYQADKQFMPLGGNTIFVREALVRRAGGWPVTLTEDCSLGVLLSTGYKTKTAVYYDPRLATQEETPGSLSSLFKQRVRWNQGFFHEWRKGVWLDLPTYKQRLLASYVLLGPLLLAVISIFMIISLLAIFYLKAPVALAMMMYLPLIPVSLLAILNGMFLHDFSRAFGRRVKLRHYVLLFLTQPFYQVILNTAALWSVVRELRGNQTWHKTSHSGLHLSPDILTGNASLRPANAAAAVASATGDILTAAAAVSSSAAKSPAASTHRVPAKAVTKKVKRKPKAKKIRTAK